MVQLHLPTSISKIWNRLVNPKGKQKQQAAPEPSQVLKVLEAHDDFKQRSASQNWTCVQRQRTRRTSKSSNESSFSNRVPSLGSSPSTAYDFGWQHRNSRGSVGGSNTSSFKAKKLPPSFSSSMISSPSFSGSSQVLSQNVSPKISKSFCLGSPSEALEAAHNSSQGVSQSVDTLPRSRHSWRTSFRSSWENLRGCKSVDTLSEPIGQPVDVLPRSRHSWRKSSRSSCENLATCSPTSETCVNTVVAEPEKEASKEQVVPPKKEQVVPPKKEQVVPPNAEPIKENDMLLEAPRKESKRSASRASSVSSSIFDLLEANRLGDSPVFGPDDDLRLMKENLASMFQSMSHDEELSEKGGQMSPVIPRSLIMESCKSPGAGVRSGHMEPCKTPESGV